MYVKATEGLVQQHLCDHGRINQNLLARGRIAAKRYA